MPDPNGRRPWKFTIWGSRGSVPVSTPDIRSYGGQTTCHELELPTGRIIIDAGSGLVELGRERPNDRRDTLLLFTHVHWDHIVGFPFFTPLFESGWNLDVRGVPRAGRSVYESVCELNRPPIFPVALRDVVQANITYADLPETGGLEFHGVHVEWMEVAHPGGCSAFALTIGSKRIIFTGDVEILDTDRPALIDFCRGADVLICDAQYRTAEYEKYRGWGHSTNIHAAELARDSHVSRLILTHHDPTHGDEIIDSMIEEARAIFPVTDGARNRMVVAHG